MNQVYRKPYKIPYKLRKEIINDALILSYNTRVDELDCNKSFARITSKKSPDEALKIAIKDKKTLWHFIRRYEVCGEPARFDVGFTTMTDLPDLFLFLSLTISDGEKLIKKYKLKTL